MKFIGKASDEMCKYAFDYHSILHFIGGVFGFIAGYSLFRIYIDDLTACFLAYLTILIGSLMWEFVENTIFVYLKPNGQQDNALNSITDTSLMFLGGIAGIYIYTLSVLAVIITIGVMFLIYIMCWILTEKKFWKKWRH